jgi:molybdopterin synthase catalytic subunit
MALRAPSGGRRDWIALSAEILPVAEAMSWAVLPGCGAVVAFTGTVRDHADGRRGVTALEYEAYEGPAEDRLAAVAAEARVRWPQLGRIALLHRTGRLELCETAVIVVASAPHRGEAFEAASWCIDTLKATAPIWKKEEWAGGIDWGTGAQPLGAGEPLGAVRPG